MLRSNFEKRVHFQLEGKAVDSFLPLIEKTHVWNDRKKRLMEPLFRGYIFVRTDLRNRWDILETDGVVRFVGIANVPSRIPDREIEYVRRAVGQAVNIRREEYVVAGERVAVVSGPLQGIEGFVVRTKSSSRVVISLHVIARAVSVEVDADALQILGRDGKSFRFSEVPSHAPDVPA